VHAISTGKKKVIAKLSATSIDVEQCVEDAIDEDVRDRFNRLELRLERLDATISQLEKRLSDGFGQMNARLEGIENRLAHKADNWVVSLWGATLAMLSAGAFALAKLWP
jgi:hypothetical protein